MITSVDNGIVEENTSTYTFAILVLMFSHSWALYVLYNALINRSDAKVKFSKKMMYTAWAQKLFFHFIVIVMFIFMNGK